MTNVITPTPASPWSTYMNPQVMSLNQIRIAWQKDRAHAKEHEHTREDHRQTGHDYGQVIELVVERVFGKFSRRRCPPPHKPQSPSTRVSQVDFVRPYRPEVQ